MHWEKIDDVQIPYGSGIFRGNVGVILSRAKVPGGWLVLAVTQAGISETPTAITFYPDPPHTWDGGKAPLD